MKISGQEKNISLLVWMLKNIFLVMLLLTVVVALVAYLGGWRSLPAYGSGIKYSAMTLLVLAGLVLLASLTRSPMPGSGSNIRSSRPHVEHINEHFEQKNSAMIFVIIAVVAAVLLYVIGELMERSIW